MGRPMRDLTDQRFGRLTAIRPVGRKFGKNFHWLCRCDCGREVEVNSSHLTAAKSREKTVSCGCWSREKAAETSRITGHLRRTHGASGTPEYSSYKSMLRRCYNQNYRCYELYGGRGITVCDRWRKSFGNFLDDMGPRPEGTSLDRIDNQRGYEPGNCRWASQRQQLNNTRVNVVIEHDGRRMTLAEWARETGIHPRTLGSRLFRNKWDIQAALTRPARKKANPDETSRLY